jgi:hypothetical protein
MGSEPLNKLKIQYIPENYDRLSHFFTFLINHHILFEFKLKRMQHFKPNSVEQSQQFDFFRL